MLNQITVFFFVSVPQSLMLINFQEQQESGTKKEQIKTGIFFSELIFCMTYKKLKRGAFVAPVIVKQCLTLNFR